MIAGRLWRTAAAWSVQTLMEHVLPGRHDKHPPVCRRICTECSCWVDQRRQVRCDSRCVPVRTSELLTRVLQAKYNDEVIQQKHSNRNVTVLEHRIGDYRWTTNRSITWKSKLCWHRTDGRTDGRTDEHYVGTARTDWRTDGQTNIGTARTAPVGVRGLHLSAFVNTCSRMH